MIYFLLLVTIALCTYLLYRAKKESLNDKLQDDQEEQDLREFRKRWHRMEEARYRHSHKRVCSCESSDRPPIGYGEF